MPDQTSNACEHRTARRTNLGGRSRWMRAKVRTTGPSVAAPTLASSDVGAAPALPLKGSCRRAPRALRGREEGRRCSAAGRKRFASPRKAAPIHRSVGRGASEPEDKGAGTPSSGATGLTALVWRTGLRIRSAPAGSFRRFSVWRTRRNGVVRSSDAVASALCQPGRPVRSVRSDAGPRLVGSPPDAGRQRATPPEPGSGATGIRPRHHKIRQWGVIRDHNDDPGAHRPSHSNRAGCDVDRAPGLG
jgi:hypothetical protein